MLPLEESKIELNNMSSKDNLVCPVKRLVHPVKRITNEDGIGTNVVDSFQLGNTMMPIQGTYAMDSDWQPKLEEIVKGHRIIVAPNDCKWLTEFLKYRNFTPGSYNFIEADTGCGKTTFVEQILFYRYPMVLYVTNRLGNKEQFLVRNKFWNGLGVISYQGLEKAIHKNGDYIDQFACVVFDEFSYILSDALVSGLTGITVRKILESQMATKFFLSATIQDSKEFFLKKLTAKYGQSILRYCTEYRMIPKTKPVTSVHEVDWEYLVPIINQSNHKWLIFVRDGKTGMSLTRKLTDSVYLDKETIRTRGQAKRTFEKIISTETFDEKVVVCTSVLDSGVNLKMRDLKSIVLDCNVRDQIRQEFGRKRFIDESDTVNLYIISRDRKKLESDKIKAHRKLKLALNFKYEFTYSGWPNGLSNEASEEGNFYRMIIYNDAGLHTHIVNDQAIRQLQIELRDLERLINCTDPFYKKLNWLFGENAKDINVGMTMTDIVRARVMQIDHLLRGYLRLEMTKLGDEAKEFRKKFTELFQASFGLDADENHRSNELLSFDKINVQLEKLGFKFKFEQYNISKKAHVMLVEEKDRNN